MMLRYTLIQSIPTRINSEASPVSDTMRGSAQNWLQLGECDDDECYLGITQAGLACWRTYKQPTM